MEMSTPNNSLILPAQFDGPREKSSQKTGATDDEYNLSFPSMLEQKQAPERKSEPVVQDPGSKGTVTANNTNSDSLSPCQMSLVEGKVNKSETTMPIPATAAPVSSISGFLQSLALIGSENNLTAGAEAKLTDGPEEKLTEGIKENLPTDNSKHSQIPVPKNPDLELPVKLVEQTTITSVSANPADKHITSVNTTEHTTTTSEIAAAVQSAKPITRNYPETSQVATTSIAASIGQNEQLLEPTKILAANNANEVANMAPVSSETNAAVENTVPKPVVVENTVPKPVEIMKDVVLASNKTTEDTYHASGKTVKEMDVSILKQSVNQMKTTTPAEVKSEAPMINQEQTQAKTELPMPQTEAVGSTAPITSSETSTNIEVVPVTTESGANLEPFTVPVEINSGSIRTIQTPATATATATSSISADIRQQVVEHLASRMEGPVGSEKVTLHLNPERLGQIEVQITAKNDALTVVLTVPEGQVEKAIHDSVKDLTESLLARGGRFQQVDVKIEAKSAQGERDQQKDNANKDKESGDQKGNHQNHEQQQQSNPEFSWASAEKEG